MSRQTFLGAICGKQGNYGIVFRDFPGCTSAGETIEDTVRQGREALQGHIEVMIDYGEAVPEPTQHSLQDVATWLAEPDEEDVEEWVALVPVEVTISARSPEVHIDLPRPLLTEIETVSVDPRQFVLEATRRELERLKKSA